MIWHLKRARIAVAVLLILYAVAIVPVNRSALDAVPTSASLRVFVSARVVE